MTTIKPLANQLPEFVCKTTQTEHQVTTKNDPYYPLIAIYLLRLVLALKAELPLLALDSLYDENQLGLITGLAAVAANHPDGESLIEAGKEQQIYQQLEQQLNHLLSQGMQIDAPLFNNIDNLAVEFQLSQAEQELLVVSLLMAANLKFNAFVREHCLATETTSINDYLCLMTNRALPEIKNCLKRTGTLFRTGWLDPLEKLNPACLLAPHFLLFNMLTEQYSNLALRQLFFTPCKNSTLEISAYPDLKHDLAVVIPYLQNALTQQICGVNLLIYGASAPSKRELARLIAKTVNSRLVEIVYNQGNSSDLEITDRFTACQSTQVWLSQRGKTDLILFDDTDAIFTAFRPNYDEADDQPISNMPPSLLRQQFLTNPVPIIWIIDRVNRVDSEFLQRFDYALRIDKMPDDLRHKRIVKATNHLDVSSQWQQHLTKRDEIPLREIRKAAAIAKISNTDNLSSEQIIEAVLNSHCQLFNRPIAFQHFKPVTQYDLQFTNTSIALDDLVKGLKRHPHGNFCFFGAPGTGKTAFAKHLADQLGMPILIKRASDILNKYLGQTEKSTARMFREAQRDGAILLLDEADTFLSDRNSNRYSWENSKINEMLVQMENFEGIFICTTNLMERMDSASLRRFDFKVKFDYLNAEQRWGLFAQESQRLGAKLPTDEQSLQTIQQQIYRLTKLTPGDFAVLSRQSKFQEQPFTLSEMLNILQQECVAKGEQFSRIGFVH